MKLTNYDKEIILRGITRDLPEIDDSAAIQAALVKAMSPACRKLYNTAPSALRTIYKTNYQVFQPKHSHNYIAGDADEVTALAPFLAKREARSATLRKVDAAVKACNTLKQLLERLPEFSRYAPAEVTKAKNELVVVNAVAELSKLGWPSGQKDKAKAQ